MSTVSGFIRTETGGPALGATVRAFDKDLRHEQLLGEIVVTETSGRYSINYTADQFRRADKRTADLIVRAWDENDNLRAESAIIFNAPDTATIDLTFGALPSLSEYEVLILTLRPVLEGVALVDLSDSDITFLIGETRLARQRVEFLRHSARLNRETRIQAEAFYAWARRNLPLELDQLLAEPFERLRRELIAAAQQRIIPDLSAQLDYIAGRLDALQLETGRQTIHTFVGRLLEDRTLGPLSEYTIRVSDPDAPAGAADLAQDITDSRGFFSFPFALPANTDGSQPPSRRLQLLIFDRNGESAGRTTVTGVSDQQDVVTVRIRVPTPADETDAPIETLAPAGLTALLRERGFRTLSDLRTRGLSNVSGIDSNSTEVRRLVGHANLSLVSSIATERDTLLVAGFRDPVAIARARRSDFVTATQAQLGDARAARFLIMSPRKREQWRNSTRR
jgi:hypothetical protein